MRPIEFRAWDKKFEMMLGSMDIAIALNLAGVAMNLEIESSTSEVRAYRKDESGRYILMQFTGLLDRNGKKIFEGDIVNAISDKSVIISNCAIEYRNGIFGIWNGNNFPHTFLHLEDIEVIGNIYEHKNLIDNK